MNRRAVLMLPLLASLPALAAPARAAEPVPVVASFTILADLVHAVGGDAVRVTSIIGPNGDAHGYQPKPSDLKQLMAASIAVVNGLGLDPWMGRMQGSAGFKGKTVVASTGVKTRTFREHGSTVTDPHIWQDPRNAVLMVRNIATGLGAADPANASAYQARATALTDAIMKQDAAIEQALSAIPPERRRIITTHDAFGYYGARFGVQFLAAEGISTESEPTPRAMARLVAQIKRDKVKAVFIENMTDPRIAEAIARESGAVLGGTVFSDSLSPPDGPAANYLDMLRHNTGLFVAAMK